MQYNRELLNILCEEMGIERRAGETGVYVGEQKITDSFQVSELFPVFYNCDTQPDVPRLLSFDEVCNKDSYPVNELENWVEAA